VQHREALLHHGSLVSVAKTRAATQRPKAPSMLSRSQSRSVGVCATLCDLAKSAVDGGVSQHCRVLYGFLRRGHRRSAVSERRENVFKEAYLAVKLRGGVCDKTSMVMAFVENGLAMAAQQPGSEESDKSELLDAIGLGSVADLSREPIFAAATASFGETRYINVMDDAVLGHLRDLCARSATSTGRTAEEMVAYLLMRSVAALNGRCTLKRALAEFLPADFYMPPSVATHTVTARFCRPADHQGAEAFRFLLDPGNDFLTDTHSPLGRHFAFRRRDAILIQAPHAARADLAFLVHAPQVHASPPSSSASSSSSPSAPLPSWSSAPALSSSSSSAPVPSSSLSSGSLSSVLACVQVGAGKRKTLVDYVQTATPGAQFLNRKGKGTTQRAAFATLAGGFPAAFRLQVRIAFALQPFSKRAIAQVNAFNTIFPEEPIILCNLHDRGAYTDIVSSLRRAKDVEDGQFNSDESPAACDDSAAKSASGQESASTGRSHSIPLFEAETGETVGPTRLVDKLCAVDPTARC